jgi:hypothetical protein
MKARSYIAAHDFGHHSGLRLAEDGILDLVFRYLQVRP